MVVDLELGHLLQLCQFHRLLGLPRPAAVVDFSHVQPVDRLGQSDVLGITLTAHRGLDFGLGQPLAAAHGQVARTRSPRAAPNDFYVLLKGYKASDDNLAMTYKPQ
jgi:hypothetical protein